MNSLSELFRVTLFVGIVCFSTVGRAEELQYRMFDIDSRDCIVLGTMEEPLFVLLYDSYAPQHTPGTYGSTLNFDRKEPFYNNCVGWLGAENGEAWFTVDGADRVWVNRATTQVRRGNERVTRTKEPVVVKVSRGKPFVALTGTEAADVLETIANYVRMKPESNNLSGITLGSRAERDYSNAVLHVRWLWRPDEVGLAASLRTTDSPFRIQKTQLRDELKISLLKPDGAAAYSIDGHWGTMFRAERDGKLYYLDYSPEVLGGKFVCIDLASGNVDWREDLQALSGIVIKTEGAIHNRIMMLPSPHGAYEYWFFGEETGGRYIEVKSAATGKTLAHRSMKLEGR